MSQTASYAMTRAGATRPPTLLNFNGYYIVESSRGDLWLVIENSNKECWVVLCAFWDDPPNGLRL
ncbi:unnamed protein product [Prunus brigantina]